MHCIYHFQDSIHFGTQYIAHYLPWSSKNRVYIYSNSYHNMCYSIGHNKMCYDTLSTLECRLYIRSPRDIGIYHTPGIQWHLDNLGTQGILYQALTYASAVVKVIASSAACARYAVAFASIAWVDAL